MKVIMMATAATAASWVRSTAGITKPSMTAPGKLYAPIEKPGRNLVSAIKNAKFRINERRPKVIRSIGSRTIVKMGFMKADIKIKPPIIKRRFWGSEPIFIVGIAVKAT